MIVGALDLTAQHLPMIGVGQAEVFVGTIAIDPFATPVADGVLLGAFAITLADLEGPGGSVDRGVAGVFRFGRGWRCIGGKTASHVGVEQR